MALALDDTLDLKDTEDPKGIFRPAQLLELRKVDGLFHCAYCAAAMHPDEVGRRCRHVCPKCQTHRSDKVLAKIELTLDTAYLIFDAPKKPAPAKRRSRS